MAEGYFLKKGETVTGPFSAKELKELLKLQSTNKANVLVGRSDDGPWTKMPSQGQLPRQGIPETGRGSGNAARSREQQRRSEETAGSSEYEIRAENAQSLNHRSTDVDVDVDAEARARADAEKHRDSERKYWADIVRNEVRTAVSNLVGKPLGRKLNKLLKSKLTMLSQDIQTHADSTVHTISCRLASELKKTEGRKSTFKLPGLKSDNQELSGLGAEELQKLGQLIAASSLTESSVTRLISDLEFLQAREQLVDDLPNLFDLVDKEVQSHEKKAGDSDTPHDTAVLEMLKRMQARMDAWMQRNNLQAFPEVGDTYDSLDQEWIKTAPSQTGQNANEVASVETRGYRFTDGDYPLRRARVICYGTPSDVIGEPGSGMPR
ncbi:MAG: nucleotide exchange factor GrpE [Fuerstiella sp.]